MTQVFLIRHGQAQTGAADEESYDSLSDLGHTQAKWLGQHLATSNHEIKRVIAGDLIRQQQTAAYIAQPLGLDVVIDPRLRELDYFSLSQSMLDLGERDMPDSRETFMEHFPELMKAWAEGRISCPNEDFAGFEARVIDALDWAETHPGTVLVTSGGVIGMTLRHVLGLSLEAFSHVLLQIHNSSVHQYQIEAGSRRLVNFNSTPHLDSIDRAGTRTHI